MNPTPDLPADRPDPPEPGRAHLLRALAALPAHLPDDVLWPRIDSELRTEQALARARLTLPVHLPEATLWARISARLDGADAPGSVSTAPPASLPALPQHTPDDALWASIAARLDAPAPPRPQWPGGRPWWLRASRTRRGVVRAGAGALLLALLVLAAGLLHRPSRPAAAVASVASETISYTEEIVVDAPAAAGVNPSSGPDTLDLSGQAFIDAHCSSLPAVCQSARFRALRGELDALTSEEQQLADDLRRFGGQPALLQHQSRVTTQKATTTRTLIRLLIS